jgi:hypothetical protein
MAADPRCRWRAALTLAPWRGDRCRLAGRSGSRNGHRLAGRSEQGRGHRSASCAAQSCNRRDNHGDTFPRNARRDPACALVLLRRWRAADERYAKEGVLNVAPYRLIATVDQIRNIQNGTAFNDAIK